MKYNKPSTSIKQQLDQLKERGLIVENEAYAVQCLQNISYYRLAGYWWPLQHDKEKHLFKPNSRFITVIKIYKFDSELRTLLFDVIEQIEVAFRTKMIYYLSHEIDPWWFENPAYFTSNRDHSESLKTIDRDLKLNKKKEVFLEQHYLKYHSDPRRPPAWKTFEVLSLGTLSKLYGNLAARYKAKDLIAADFGTVNHTYFHSWMQDLTQIRNICAHHGRIWNKNLPGRPKLLPKPPNEWIKNVPAVDEHHMLYIHLCCMKYLFNAVHPGNNFTYKLFVLLKHYPNIDLNALGMPKDWYKEPLWQNKIEIGAVVKPIYNKSKFMLSRLGSLFLRFLGKS